VYTVFPFAASQSAVAVLKYTGILKVVVPVHAAVEVVYPSFIAVLVNRTKLLQ
jgi:hypothetical protein